MSSIAELLNRDALHARILKTAGAVAASKNQPVYVVGGYVRDALLGKFNADIDIMVEGDGIAFAHALARKLNLKTVLEYNKFGTALIPHPDIQIEVASARTESYTPDSRKPQVEFTSVENDLSRRDFTINTMAADISPDRFGRLIDPFGGIRDLHRRLIITPLDPDVTFSDDPLRMMRATRFAAQLEFGISPDILKSIPRQTSRLEIVSKERITDEIIKTLQAAKPGIGLQLMKDTGLLAVVFPELDILSGVEVVDGRGHKDVFRHTLQVVDNAASLSPKMEVRFAALVHDIAKPATKKFVPGKGWTFHGHEELGRRMLFKIARRMKLSNELRDYLMVLTRLHLRPIALAKSGVSDSALRRVMFEAGEHLDDLMILCRADITTKNPEKVRKYLNNFERVEELMQDVRLRDEMRAFQSPVRGDVIMQELNLKPGRAVGRIKSAIENAILDGEIPNDYDAAFQFMITHHETILASSDPKKK